MLTIPSTRVMRIPCANGKFRDYVAKVATSISESDFYETFHVDLGFDGIISGSREAIRESLEGIQRVKPEKRSEYIDALKQGRTIKEIKGLAERLAA